MNLYLDSSAFLRSYLRRRGGTELDSEFNAARRSGTVAVTRVEVVASLTRLERGGVIRRGEVRRGIESLERDLAVTTEVLVTQEVVTRAYELVQRHGLRGYDGIQLAAADTWRSILGEDVTIATFDDDLWAAANVEGFLTWPPDLALFR